MITPTPAQKAELIEACERHAAQDMLIRGSYGKKFPTGFRGCSVGCLAYEINPNDPEFNSHGLVARHYGIPLWLVRLQDYLFEKASKDIHVKLAHAIKPRDNWNSVMHVACYRILNEIALPNGGSSREVDEKARDLHKNEDTDLSSWSPVAVAARSVERSVERSAEAARAAADSVESAEEAALLAIMNIVLDEVAK